MSRPTAWRNKCTCWSGATPSTYARRTYFGVVRYMFAERTHYLLRTNYLVRLLDYNGFCLLIYSFIFLKKMKQRGQIRLYAFCEHYSLLLFVYISKWRRTYSWSSFKIVSLILLKESIFHNGIVTCSSSNLPTYIILLGIIG